ncbi:MAG: DUF1236 domain-containing protein [Pseudolabrys sp.]|nr:DUF1236 domain-containing protein [Pseudolabrys sp.]
MTSQVRHHVCLAASALALLAGTAVASAQTTVITREPVETRTVVTERAPLQLSPAQRTVIYRTVTRERVAPVPPPTVRYQVGMRVPETVELQAVPDTVVTEVPAVRSYKYMTVNNRVWLVDPATSQIVAEVDE